MEKHADKMVGDYMEVAWLGLILFWNPVTHFSAFCRCCVETFTLFLDNGVGRIQSFSKAWKCGTLPLFCYLWYWGSSINLHKDIILCHKRLKCMAFKRPFLKILFKYNKKIIGLKQTTEQVGARCFLTCVVCVHCEHIWTRRTTAYIISFVHHYSACKHCISNHYFVKTYETMQLSCRYSLFGRIILQLASYGLTWKPCYH